ncbi:MAG: tetratricopeptide repeat protein [Armatimonadia bacterium]
MVMRFLTLLAVILAVLTPALAPAEEMPERQRVMELLAAGKEAEALEAAKSWTVTHPSLPEALLLYATVQERNDDYEGAVDSLESAHFLSRDVSVLVRKGYLQMDAGQLGQAQLTFQQALRQQETHAPAHVGLALIMLEKRNPLEAGAAARCALAIDPRSVEALVVLARLKLLEAKYAEADQYLQQAIKINPDAPTAHLWMGRLCSEMGREDDARRSWRRYIELDGGSPTSWLLSNNLYATAARPHPCTGYYPVFSPDGKLLAFRGRGDAGCVYLSEVNKPEQFVRIYQGNGTLYTMEWSSDSKYLMARDYVQEQVDGKPQYKYRLIVMEAKEGGEAKTIQEGRYIGTPSWSRDCKSILYDGYIQGKGRPLLSLPITGGEPQILLMPQNGESFSGVLAHPDGQHLLVQRWMAKDKEYQIAQIDPADRTRDQVLSRGPYSFYYMSLTPDGRFVSYFRRIGQPPTWQMMILPLEGGGPAHPMGLRLTYMLLPAFTHDMKHVLIYENQGMMLHDLSGVRE